jgi:cyclase|tara:strand:+ start:273 stop:1076 length:804 start_codon:yes stop_codon:yes gene_type:complete
VKGIHLEGLRVLGKPWDFARYYYENGTDELIFQDVVASLYGRNCLQEIISKTAREVFIPLTVGGGLRTIDDINKVLRSGADKVSLNTAAIKDEKFIKEASKIFGTSTIVIAIEAIKQSNGEYFAYTDNGREFTGVEVVGWAKKVEELGAGEIIITSVDQDGTGSGFDIELIKSVCDEVAIPVIAHGGASTPEHVLDAFKHGSADAVAVASIIHYGFIQDNAGINHFDFEDEGNIEFLKKAKRFKEFGIESIQSIKEYIRGRGINCRI